MNRGPVACLVALTTSLSVFVACSGTSGSAPADAGRSGNDAAAVPGDSSDGPFPDAAVEASADAGPPVCASDAGPPSPAEFAVVPTCQPSSCTITGTLDGAATLLSYTRGSKYQFVNGSRFYVDFGTGGSLALALASMVANGSPGNATGVVKMPMEGPLAGHTLCAGAGTRVEPSGPAGAASTGMSFILRCLSDGCGGDAAAIDGELDGCCMP